MDILGRGARGAAPNETILSLAGRANKGKALILSLWAAFRPRQAPQPTSRFLLRDIRMLAGEARDFASDRAGFLGSHPEAGVTRAPRNHQ